MVSQSRMTGPTTELPILQSEMIGGNMILYTLKIITLITGHWLMMKQEDIGKISHERFQRVVSHLQ